MRYQAVTIYGPFDIGEFATPALAQAAAVEQYGNELESVMPVLAGDSVTVTADAPPAMDAWKWLAVAALALIVLSPPKRKSRRKR